jgi:hypothetical protein
MISPAGMAVGTGVDAELMSFQHAAARSWPADRGSNLMFVRFESTAVTGDTRHRCEAVRT